MRKLHLYIVHHCTSTIIQFSMVMCPKILWKFDLLLRTSPSSPLNLESFWSNTVCRLYREQGNNVNREALTSDFTRRCSPFGNQDINIIKFAPISPGSAARRRASHTGWNRTVGLFGCLCWEGKTEGLQPELGSSERFQSQLKLDFFQIRNGKVFNPYSISV